MNDKYKDINFDAFSTEKDSILTETEQEAYIKQFYQSTGLQQEGKKHKTTNVRLRRKFIVLAAAMVMILAFGAVAYAGGWFNLGTINAKYDKYELIAAEDSAQYKAAKEVMDYDMSLSQEELIARENESSYTNEKEKSITYRAPREKEKEVLDKYNLEFERTHYYVNSAKKAFDKVGVGNILGDFWDINDLNDQKSNDDDIFSHYSYTDKGTVNIAGGGETANDPVHWELYMIPRNVYLSPWGAFAFPNEKKNPDYTEWEFTTEDGYHVKAASYKDSRSSGPNNSDEKDSAYRNFKALIITETHSIELTYTICIDDQSNDISNKDFENLIEKFDFAKVS